MTVTSEEIDSSTPKKEVIREGIKLQPYWHVISFFSTFIGSYLIPGVIFFIYILFFFVPFVLNTSNPVTLFTDLAPLISFLLMPIVLIGCYLLHLYFACLITRFWWRLTEKKCPSKEGVIPRNIPSRTLNFYHIRSFMIKYPKNSVVKGPFPWLANWMYNFIGTNKIGKGTTIEEQTCGEKFNEIGDNCYIGVNSMISSHLVDGVFGNISFFKNKLGNNITFSPTNCFAPGAEINDNAYLLPLACASKFNILKGNNYYFGIPLRKIFKRKIQEYLQLSEADFKMDEELRNKQQQVKNSKKKGDSERE